MRLGCTDEGTQLLRDGVRYEWPLDVQTEPGAEWQCCWTVQPEVCSAVTPIPVPEPSSLWLVLAVCVGCSLARAGRDGGYGRWSYPRPHRPRLGG